MVLFRQSGSADDCVTYRCHAARILKVRRYEIEADWQLSNTCNYRCSYCFFPPEMLGEKLRTFATPQEWRGRSTQPARFGFCI